MRNSEPHLDSNEIILFSISYFRSKRLTHLEILKSFRYVHFFSNPDGYYCSESQILGARLRAIIHPRYTRTDSFSETQKSATSFPSFSFFLFSASLYPGSSIEFLLTFLVVFYTDIFYFSIPIFIHCSAREPFRF